MTVTFRSARRDELAAIVALLADDVLGATRELVATDLDPRYSAAFDALDRDPNQQLVVAVDGEMVVGTLQLSFLPGISRLGAWRGQVEAVRIAADRRGTGLGAAMMDWAVAACRARGCSQVQLTTDRQRFDAHRFYDRLGFTPSHLGYKLTL